MLWQTSVAGSFGHRPAVPPNLSKVRELVALATPWPTPATIPGLAPDRFSGRISVGFTVGAVVNSNVGITGTNRLFDRPKIVLSVISPVKEECAWLGIRQRSLRSASALRLTAICWPNSDLHRCSFTN
jgi:hypothetical protein